MKQGIHKILLLTGSLIFAVVQNTAAQGEVDSSQGTIEKAKHWVLNGYLKDLQSIQFTDIKKKWTLDNLVHNRLDLHWYADSLWKIHVGVRNRLYYGESVPLYKQNKKLLGANNDVLSRKRIYRISRIKKPAAHNNTLINIIHRLLVFPGMFSAEVKVLPSKQSI